MNKKYDKEDRKGDQGLTSCMGGLVEKTNPRIALIGKLDTLTAKLLTIDVYLTNNMDIGKYVTMFSTEVDENGYLKTNDSSFDDITPISISRVITEQFIPHLFTIMAELSAKPSSQDSDAICERVSYLNKECSDVSRWLKKWDKNKDHWRYPSTTSACHMNEARTICRECEFMAWGATVHTKYPIYLNRLSDLLFLLTNVLSIIEE